MAGGIDAGQLGSFFVNWASNQCIELTIQAKVHSSTDIVQCGSAASHIDFAQSDLGKLDVFEIQDLQI
jgi:hypothetical protein